MPVKIHSLHVYPLKSCHGIDLESAELVCTGFKYDRRWMLVDQQGKFLSQRSHPRLALIRTRIIDDSTLVCSLQDEHIEIPIQETGSDRVAVHIWQDQCTAVRLADSIGRWFSARLGVACDLVFLPDSERRLVDPQYARQGQSVGFADGFPLLVVSLESMQLLNEKLGESLSVERFRPNIVISGCEAHAEDKWSSLSVNGIEIELVKPCSRCVIPSIDQQTGQPHRTLLRTLSTYRRAQDGRIYVGQNGLHQRSGTIRRDQRVEFQAR